MPSDWRPNLYVVARFLDALYGAPRTRSELQAAAGVNYDIFRKYLGFLKERCFLVTEESGAVRLTPAGARARAELRDLIARFFAVDDSAPAALKSLQERGAPDAEQ